MKRYLMTVTSEEAISLIVRNTGAITDEELLPAHECRDRITAKAVRAVFSNPPFLCAAMDGYAVAFRSTLGADVTSPVNLSRERNGAAVPVNTGDLLPKGMDAVIMIEDVEESASSICIRKPVYLWQNVRMIGEDLIEGDMLLPANHRIGVFDIGMMISAGVTHVPVWRRPVFTVIPTGKELVDIFKETFAIDGDPRLIDFNSYTLKNMGEETGYKVNMADIARDKNELRKTLGCALEDSDVVLINAGTSAGREDYTEEIIRERGQVLFHGVSMMPGKPTLFGVIDGRPVFGIPGYPVSAAITFKTFLVPLYEKLTNARKHASSVLCKMAYKTPSRIGIEEMIRVNLLPSHETYFAVPLGRGASIFSSMAKADGIVRIPENVEGLDEGETTTCELLRHEQEIKSRIHIIGSHDLSLDILRNLVKEQQPGTDLVSTHTGSLSGIMAVKKGITPLATSHILDEDQKTYNVPVIRKYLPETALKLIRIARRMQGLYVARGNPRHILSLADLVRSDVKFVNRQFGSGTRILFDSLLSARGIERTMISGYDREESSHTAVGILVKEAVADAGIGIYSVARAFSLDFIPLAEEEYDLVITGSALQDKKHEILVDLLNSGEFKKRLDELGGYNTSETGKVVYEQ